MDLLSIGLSCRVADDEDIFWHSTREASNMRTLIVPGEPALWSAGADARSVSREVEWKNQIRERTREASPAPQAMILQFAVKEWKRRGHCFDLDNLVTPVLRAIYGDSNREQIESRATLQGWRASVVQS